MIKKDKQNRVSLGLKCGECLHFKGAPKYGKPCVQQGVQSFAVAPNCFNPDATILATAKVDIIHQLGLLTKDFTQPQLRILTYVFKAAGTLRRASLKFGQPVWFAAGPSNYLSNYYKGYVVGCSSSGEHIHLLSNTGAYATSKKLHTTALSLLRESVFTKSEFDKQKAELIKAGHLIDPQLKARTLKIQRVTEAAKSREALDAYQPPTFDKAPKDWLALHNMKARGNKARDKRSIPVDVLIKENDDGSQTLSVNRYNKPKKKA